MKHPNSVPRPSGRGSNCNSYKYDPCLIFIAFKGHSFSQPEHPIHLSAYICIGGSKGSSWINSLCLHPFKATQTPLAGSHFRGSQMSKSIIAALE